MNNIYGFITTNKTKHTKEIWNFVRYFKSIETNNSQEIREGTSELIHQCSDNRSQCMFVHTK